ncbi:MAG: hypothetical protein WC297_00560 [Candidatus Paceibacterota bacterium]|jgi:hypothetical protein
MDSKNYENFIKRVEKEAKKEKLDLSSDEDLSIAIMNLVSLEEHFFFTAKKTEKDKYFDLLNEVREIRKSLLKEIVKDYEGEVWCISKHLLAASMRLYEVGTKELHKGNDEKAKGLFEKSYNLYSLFWGINLKTINIGEVKKLEDGQLNKQDSQKSGVFAKLSEVVKKLIDCCKE